ncbi:MAG: hypothetical protein ACKO9H_11405 [Planctomycetota bacterium]
MPVFELANQQMDLMLARAFRSTDDSQASLAEFQDRCSRRFHNFHPPRPRDATPPEPTPPEPTPIATLDNQQSTAEPTPEPSASS